jgi:predicted RNase H-like HicB family nuclease
MIQIEIAESADLIQNSVGCAFDWEKQVETDLSARLMTPFVKLQLSVLISIEKEDGDFRVMCPFLNMTTYGKSQRTAVENLKEEIEFLFFARESLDGLVALLDKRSSETKEPPIKKDVVQVDSLKVDLPATMPPDVQRRLADASHYPLQSQ